MSDESRSSSSFYRWIWVPIVAPLIVGLAIWAGQLAAARYVSDIDDLHPAPISKNQPVDDPPPATTPKKQPDASLKRDDSKPTPSADSAPPTRHSSSLDKKKIFDD